MLTIRGKRQFFCDGMSRRNFLQIGAVSAGGLALADLLRLEAQAGPSATRKSIINIYLPGGPTHMDTFDLKPEAPSEYRGEFNPIATNVPGMEICELMPNLAKVADKYALVRSITGLRNEHRPNQSDSGWNELSLRMLGGRPGIGAVVSKLHGTVNGTAPTSVSLSGFGSSGFLGPEYNAYRPDSYGRANLTLNRSISEERLSDRNSLLGSLDRMRRDMDQSQRMEAMDEFNQRATTVVTSGQLGDALDTTKEDPKILEQYGVNQGGRFSGNQNFLLARRLIQAGVRVVGLSWGGWDTHGNNFATMRSQLPALDVGLSSLLNDLEAHGMLDDTIVLMSGEFGRTPRINSGAGRDHWPAAAFWFIGGGGLRTGQVIGSTNRLGERALDRPVHVQQVYATVYRQLGVNLSTKIDDPAGRPQYILEHRDPIAELL
jgi:hypothetical protein